MDAVLLKEVVSTMEGIKESQKRLEGSVTPSKSGPSSKTDTPAASFVSPEKVSSSRFVAELVEISKRIEVLEKMVKSLVAMASENERKLDDLEQYGRSNCLILHKCKNVPTGSYHSFLDYLLGIFHKMSCPVEKFDIDIAHVLPTSLPKEKGTPIIVKFVRRSVRNAVFAKKKVLAGTGMAITESLTKRRLRLVDEARKIVGFKMVWTMKGVVYAMSNGRRQVISSIKDVGSLVAS